jgi:hypothetical protein
MRWRHVLPALAVTREQLRALATAPAARARTAVAIVIALVFVISGAAVTALPAAAGTVPPPSLLQAAAPPLAWRHPVLHVTAASSGAPYTRSQLRQFHLAHLRHLTHLAHLAHLRYLASLRAGQVSDVLVTRPRTQHPASHSSARTYTTSYSGSPQAIAKEMMPSYGWSVSGQFGCLDELWIRESGWNRLAMNPGSGAFGIAQALGHGLSGTGGTYGNQYPSRAANDGDTAAQEKWGLTYVEDTYGSPCGAWAHETARGWY